jgi:hypothetical protein
MDSQLQKTLIFVGAAVLLTGAAALVSRPDRAISTPIFEDQGKPFFPDFKDPTVATTLEVIDYDPATATITPFKVTSKSGKWTIPSHYDYPADAKQRLVDTATGVIGLTKDAIRSDNAQDHEGFGVIDPLDGKATSLKGIGKRVTLKDATDKTLADFIIGDAVKDHPDQRYVRVPGQKRTYGVKVKADLSTRFADWIETNLLKLDTSRVRKVVIDHKKLDPDKGLIPGDVITLERKDASSPWVLDTLPDGKEPNSETLLALANALGDLKIAGIRPKPEGLTADLMEAPGLVKPTTRQALMSLANKGFYLTKQGLFSNQGEVTVVTDEGIRYTLRFGEAVFASGNELSAGSSEEKEKEAKGKDAKKTEGTSEGRYLFVTAAFDPALLPPPKPSTDPDAKFPDDPFAYDDPAEKRVVNESEAAKERAAKQKAERDKQVADGEKRAKELSDRFAAWYYVTPGDSFRTIVVERPSLIRDKTAKTPAPGGGRPGLPPGFGGPGGMPGGLPFNPH